MSDSSLVENMQDDAVFGPFGAEEYANRLRRLRDAMREHSIDLMLVHSTENIAYLTGYETPRGNTYACLVVPVQGKIIAHLYKDEVDMMPEHEWLSEIIPVSGSSVTPNQELIDLLQSRKVLYGVIGIEIGRYPMRSDALLRLRELVPEANIFDASRLIIDLRVVKSPAEIDCMKKAASFTNVGMRAAVSAIRVGATDNDIGAAAYAAMVRAGSEAAYPAPFVMAGDRSGWGPHLSWKRFPLMIDDPVSIELTGVYWRYAAPMYRTAVLGKPSKLLREMSDAGLEALNLVLENAYPGRSAHEVATAAAKALDPIRSKVSGSGSFGYGVGLMLSPNWVEHSFRIVQGNDRPIVPGMAFHSPTAFRAPGELGVAFSETWIMTDSGPEVLTEMPRELLVCES